MNATGNPAIDALANSPVRRHQTPETPAAETEKPAESTEQPAGPTEPGFADIVSLVRAHAAELGKGDKKPFEVTVGDYRRFVFAESVTKARKLVCTTVRAIDSQEIIVAMSAALPKSET